MPGTSDRAAAERRMLLEHRTIKLLTGELDAQLAGVADKAIVSSYIRAAVCDLRGSVCPDALPEMAARLVRHRLSAAGAVRSTESPRLQALSSATSIGGASSNATEAPLR